MIPAAFLLSLYLVPQTSTQWPHKSTERIKADRGLQEGSPKVVASRLKDEWDVAKWKRQERKFHWGATAQARAGKYQRIWLLRQGRNCWTIWIKLTGYKGTLPSRSVQYRRVMETCQITWYMRQTGKNFYPRTKNFLLIYLTFSHSSLRSSWTRRPSAGRGKELWSQRPGVYFPEAVWLTTSLNLGLSFSTKEPLIPTSQHCTLLFLTVVWK